MGPSPFIWSFILYVSNTKYEIMQPTYNFIQNTKNPPLLEFFTSDSRSLVAMYVDSSIGTSTSWAILTSKGPWCEQTNFRFVHKIVQLFLKKEPRFFCGFFCCAISVDLFLVQTPDAVPRSNPMRHSHFTNHVAMAVRESYITFFKTLLASDHPLPKQTSQKPSWGKENKIKVIK